MSNERADYASQLAISWWHGRREAVIAALRRSPPLEAAHLALYVHGFMLQQHDKADAVEFVRAITTAIDEGEAPS